MSRAFGVVPVVDDDAFHIEFPLVLLLAKEIVRGDGEIHVSDSHETIIAYETPYTK